MAFEIDPAQAAHDFDHGRVSFYATDHGVRVLCAVSDEALQDLARETTANPEELVNLYRENCLVIAAAAESRLRRGLIERDGYVVVRYSDLL